MRELDKDDKNPRYWTFIIIVGLIFSILVYRLFNLQILQASTYEERANRNRIRSNVVKSIRGEIYDRDGNILARNTTGYQLVHYETKNLSQSDIDVLKQIQSWDLSEIQEYLQENYRRQSSRLLETIEDIKIISELTGYTTDFLINRFAKQPRSGSNKKIIVIEDLDKNIALKSIEKLIKNDRIDIIEYNKRFYPEDSIASNVIGYIKPINDEEYEINKDKGYLIDDMYGKKGIEREYDYEMKGHNGEELVEVDVYGNVIKTIQREESIRGKDVYLSIDLDLEKYMTNLMIGKSGAFIAVEVDTGKVITFVSAPEISLNMLSGRISESQWNELVNSPSTPLVNKGITGLYPPGSTFKVVTAMGILESGISPTETVNSTGEYRFGTLTFRDSSRYGHGRTNLAKSIEESVNTYYYVLSQRAGVDNIVKYAKEFGVGEKTGIDIPGEQSGVLPSPEWKKNRFESKSQQVWVPGDLINMSIGQGYVLMTPLQVVMIYQAIANNGVMMKPTVIDKFIDYKGDVEIKKPEILRTLTVQEKNIKIIQNSLRLPVMGKRGTAKILNIAGYPVSAKTGTAQNTGFKDHHSWIAGYFPSNNPKIAFVALVEGGGYGGLAAGHLAREFIDKYREKYEFNMPISE